MCGDDFVFSILAHELAVSRDNVGSVLRSDNAVIHTDGLAIAVLYSNLRFSIRA